jgi:hypothetical protein
LESVAKDENKPCKLASKEITLAEFQKFQELKGKKSSNMVKSEEEPEHLYEFINHYQQKDPSAFEASKRSPPSYGSTFVSCIERPAGDI